MAQGDAVENHPGWTQTDLELALPEGHMILGYTLQLKVLTAEGRTGMLTLQRDVDDAEAAGMVKAHQLALDQDLLEAMHDPREE